MGLDYLHRFCKIIHTDLKPENVIVSLSKKELAEIYRSGQISTMNKNVRTLDLAESTTLMASGNQATLL